MQTSEETLRVYSVLLIHKLVMRAKQREYYNAHKEQCKKYIDPDKQKIALRKYYQKHPDRVKLRVRQWLTNNPDKARVLWKLRGYRERNAIGKFTVEEWNIKLEKYNYCCAYCGCKLSTDVVTIDHVIPISRGGSNYIENLVPACRSCNSRKSNKTSQEYYARI